MFFFTDKLLTLLDPTMQGGEAEGSGYSATNQKPGEELLSHNVNKREKRANESLETKSTETKRAKMNYQTDAIENTSNSLQTPGTSLILNPNGSKLAHQNTSSEKVVDANATDNKSNMETATSALKINKDNCLKVMAEVKQVGRAGAK